MLRRALLTALGCALIATVTFADEDPCADWHLQGYRPGMDAETALELHDVKKQLRPGSIAWKSMLMEHTGAQRRKDVPQSGYDIYQLFNEPPDKSRFLIIKDGKVAGYRTTRPKTPNEIVRGVSTILGNPVWTGDLSTEIHSMGTVAQWENPDCNTVLVVGRVPTARIGKVLLAEDLTGNEATDTLLRIASYAEEVEGGKNVLD